MSVKFSNLLYAHHDEWSKTEKTKDAREEPAQLLPRRQPVLHLVQGLLHWSQLVLHLLHPVALVWTLAGTEHVTGRLGLRLLRPPATHHEAEVAEEYQDTACCHHDRNGCGDEASCDEKK